MTNALGIHTNRVLVAAKLKFTGGQGKPRVAKRLKNLLWMP